MLQNQGEEGSFNLPTWVATVQNKAGVLFTILLFIDGKPKYYRFCIYFYIRALLFTPSFIPHECSKLYEVLDLPCTLYFMIASCSGSKIPPYLERPINFWTISLPCFACPFQYKRGLEGSKRINEHQTKYERQASQIQREKLRN